MYRVLNYNWTETKFIIIHGKLVFLNNSIDENSNYMFECCKVTENDTTGTPRQFVEVFETYPEMVAWVETNIPEQVENIPVEEDM